MKRLMVLLVVGLVCTSAALTGCGEKKTKDTAKSTMTEAARDSAIAASKLPGAGVVGRALEVSDSAKARAERLDEDQP